MKSWTKRIVLSASVAVLSFVLISFSCAKTPVKGTAGTVYAESDAGAGRCRRCCDARQIESGCHGGSFAGNTDTVCSDDAFYNYNL